MDDDDIQARTMQEKKKKQNNLGVGQTNGWGTEAKQKCKKNMQLFGKSTQVWIILC